MSDRTCSIDGCEKPSRARGWCNRHWMRWRRHGDPEANVGDRHHDVQKALDARSEWQGECLVWTGALTHGYGHIRVQGADMRVHRLAWESFNGPIPEGMVLDHACWNRACFNVAHLRLASRGDNAAHLSRPHCTNTVGVRNVSPSKKSFVVRVRKDGVIHRRGPFRTLPEAAEAAHALRLELRGKFAGVPDYLDDMEGQNE